LLWASKFISIYIMPVYNIYIYSTISSIWEMSKNKFIKKMSGSLTSNYADVVNVFSVCLVTFMGIPGSVVVEALCYKPGLRRD
jgi:hypothetical protein